MLAEAPQASAPSSQPRVQPGRRRYRRRHERMQHQRLVHARLAEQNGHQRHSTRLMHSQKGADPGTRHVQADVAQLFILAHPCHQGSTMCSRKGAGTGMSGCASSHDKRSANQAIDTIEWFKIPPHASCRPLRCCCDARLPYRPLLGTICMQQSVCMHNKCPVKIDPHVLVQRCSHKVQALATIVWYSNLHVRHIHL